MSLLLNALKKAEEGENKDGQTPASESGAQAPEAAASAPPAVAPSASTPPTPSAPPVAAAPGASAPDPSAAPAAPAARPGGLTGGGLSLKKGVESSAPPPSLEKPGAMPTPATAAAGRMAGPAGIGGGMGLKKTVTPAAAHQAAAAAAEGGGGPDLVVDDDSARSAASRIFRGGGGGGGDMEDDDDTPRFRGLRNFLVAAAFLAAVGGGGYFTLEAGLIPGVSTQSVLQLVGLQPPPPPPVASQQAFPELNVADGAVLRLPRPAIDVQSEIDFTDLPEARIGSDDREEYVQRIAVLTGYNAAREAQLARERSEQEAQLAASLAEFGDGDLAGLVVEQGESAEGVQKPAGRQPLPDEIFTAEESRSEKARIEALTPSEDDIRIISASEKIALAMAAEEMAAESGAMAEESPAGEGESAQAEEGQPAEGGSEGAAADEAGESPKPEKAPAKETEPLQPKESMVAPSLKGEERRVALERAKGFYLAGRLEAAEAAYRAILRRDANNVDAMRGIAKVATSSGRRQLATTMYSQILTLYPKDPIAIAELANLQENADPTAVERRIRAVIGDQPEADARLYFSLGNLYAGRDLWSKAQEVYFEAVALEPDNPDYAYNLAVVLDYLNKPNLAARYYRQAVNLAEKSPSGFNLSRTRARIQDLER